MLPSEAEQHFIKITGETARLSLGKEIILGKTKGGAEGDFLEKWGLARGSPAY